MTSSTTGETGALIQLACRGPQNRYLDGPDMSYFTTVWKRHTRFSVEHREHFIPNGFVWGRRNTTDIPFSGDALGNMYLEIRLPVIPGAAPEDVWKPKVGYVLLRRVKVFLNEIMLSDQERLWYDLADRLFCSASHAGGLQEMVGSPNLSLTEPHTLVVPLRMPWSQRNFLPLIALPGAGMSMEIETEAFQQCIDLSAAARVPGTYSATSLVIESATYTATGETVRIEVSWPTISPPSSVTIDLLGPEDVVIGTNSFAQTLVLNNTLTVDWHLDTHWSALTVQLNANTTLRRRILAASLAPPTPELDARLLAQYAFLDVAERHVFLRSHTLFTFDAQCDMESKTYKEVSSMEGMVTRTALSKVKVDLSEINFPVKGLVWVVYPEDFSTSALFSYDLTAVQSSQLFLNGQELGPERPGTYYQLCTTLSGGPTVNSSPGTGIHFLSFALDAEALQPSGSLAFDKAKAPYLEVTIADTSLAPQHAVVKVFAIVRRYLTLYKGMARFITI